VSVIARIISTGWTRPSAWGKPAASRLSPAHSSVAQGPGGVEPAGNPFPFLQVAEERAGHPQIARFDLGRQGNAGAATFALQRLGVVPDGHPVDGRDPGRAGLAGSTGRAR
jgi:hypothetical protein